MSGAPADRAAGPPALDPQAGQPARPDPSGGQACPGPVHHAGQVIGVPSPVQPSTGAGRHVHLGLPVAAASVASQAVAGGPVMQRVWCADEGLRHARCHIPWEPTTLRRSAEFFLLNASAGSVPPPGHVAVAVAGHPDNLCLTGLYRNTIYILLPGSGSGAALRPDRRPAQYAVGPLTCRPATSDRPEPPGAGRRVPVAAGLRRRSPWPWSWAVQASPGSSRRDCRTQEVKYRNAIYCVGGYSWCEQAGPAPEDFRHLLAFRVRPRQFPQAHLAELRELAATLTELAPDGQVGKRAPRPGC